VKIVEIPRASSLTRLASGRGAAVSFLEIYQRLAGPPHG
jgi:hypothetical protein